MTFIRRGPIDLVALRAALVFKDKYFSVATTLWILPYCDLELVPGSRVERLFPEPQSGVLATELPQGWCRWVGAGGLI